MPSYSRHPLERRSNRSGTRSARRPFTAGEGAGAGNDIGAGNRPASRNGFGGGVRKTFAPSEASSSRAACLADARRGDVVAILDIFFDSVRSHCRNLGIGRGDVLVCRSRDGAGVLLDHEDYGSIYLDADRARFISVQEVMAVA